MPLREALARLRIVLTADNKELQKGLGGAADGVGSLGKAVAGFAATWGAMEVAQATAELFNLGEQAKNAQQGLIGVSGGAQQAATNLAAMRAGTGGALSDLQAMTQATKLLSLGIVSGSAEMEQFAHDAAVLGAAVGMDATAAIENMASTIANQSIVRLDQMGLSSARVRMRIEELTAANSDLSREQAFTIATMEEMSAAAVRLDEAGVQVGTTLERMTAAAENARIGFGEGLVAALATVTDSAYLTDEAASAAAVDFRVAGNAAAQFTLDTLGLTRGLDMLGGSVDWVASLHYTLTGEAQRASDALIDEKNAAVGAARGMDVAAASGGQLTGVLGGVFDAAMDAVGALAALGQGQLLTQHTALMKRGDVGGLKGIPLQNQVGGLMGARSGRFEVAQRLQREMDQAIAVAERGATRSAREVGRANRSALTEAEKAARGMEQAYESAFNDIQSAARSALTFNESVGTHDALLDQFGLRNQNTSDELVRRLADIRQRALEGREESPWLQMFPELQGAEGQELAARAQAAIEAVKAGLRFDLLDRGGVLQDVRETILGRRRMEDYTAGLAAELAKDFAPEEIQRALGETFGVAVVGAGETASGELIDSLARGLDTEMQAQREEIQRRGELFMGAFLDGARRGTKEPGIIGPLIEAVTTEVMEQLAERL